MSEVLSRRLNLKLNNFPIILNKKPGEAELVHNGIKRVGLLGRLLIKTAKGEILYWAKNGVLKYLNQGTNLCITPLDGKASSPGDAFQTTAFFHYTGGVLSCFAFQIINNPSKARSLMEAFEEKITAQLGPATRIEPPFKTWQDGGEKLILDFPEGKRNGYIHLMLGN